MWGGGRGEEEKAMDASAEEVGRNSFIPAA